VKLENLNVIPYSCCCRASLYRKMQLSYWIYYWPLLNTAMKRKLETHVPVLVDFETNSHGWRKRAAQRNLVILLWNL